MKKHLIGRSRLHVWQLLEAGGNPKMAFPIMNKVRGEAQYRRLHADQAELLATSVEIKPDNSTPSASRLRLRLACRSSLTSELNCFV